MSDETIPRLPDTVWPREGEDWPRDADGDAIAITSDGRAWSLSLGRWYEVKTARSFAAAFVAERARADSLDAALKRRTAQTFKALDNGDAFADAADSWKARAERAEAIIKAERVLTTAQMAVAEARVDRDCAEDAGVSRADLDALEKACAMAEAAVEAATKAALSVGVEPWIVARL